MILNCIEYFLSCIGIFFFKIEDVTQVLASGSPCTLWVSEVELNGSEESEGTDKPDTEGDLLTKMIRENLNKAVNDSDDSFTDGNTDDMKQSLLNAIKNTLRSSNSSRHQATDTDGEEAVANSSVASHPDSDLDIDEDESLLDLNTCLASARAASAVICIASCAVVA